MSNVINFPRYITKETNPTTELEYIQVTGKLRESLSDEITDTIMQSCVNMLFTNGLFSDIEELNIRDAIFLEETIRAVVYRYKNIDHSFHEIIVDVISMPDDEDEDEDEEDDEEVEPRVEKDLTQSENSVTLE